MNDPRLHGPESCPVRCAVCVCADDRSRHHWIEDGFDPADDPDESMGPEGRRAVLDYDRAHGTNHAEAFYGCKHCPAWAECDYVWDLEDAP